MGAPSGVRPKDHTCSSVQPITHNGVAVVMDGERGKVQEAISEFMAIVPDAILLHGASRTPVHVRRENKRKAMEGYSAGLIRRGTEAIRTWLSFCHRNRLRDLAMPADVDTIQWCLREGDEEARRRCVGKKSQGGATWEHSTANAFRWLAGIGLPFSAAREVEVRKASVQKLEKEPQFAEMWEVAIVIHLLRLAVFYRGAGAEFVCPLAAGAFTLAMASLRMVDGLRSRPPVRDELKPVGQSAAVAALHSIAAATKAKKQSRMPPMPWWAPLVSPDPCISNAQMEKGLVEAFGMLPEGAPSMFMGWCDARGRACGVQKACTWASVRVTPARLVSALAWLLTWQQLGMTMEEARLRVKKEHAARHFIPELGRVMMLPAPARDELGRWKVMGGRMRRLSNRYSRAGERIMQITLRTVVSQWICLRLRDTNCGALERVPLEHFVASAVQPVMMCNAYDDMVEVARDQHDETLAITMAAGTQ